jgi:hypothetical protein
LGSSGLGEGPTAGALDLRISIHVGEFHDHLSDYQLLKRTLLPEVNPMSVTQHLLKQLSHINLDDKFLDIIETERSLSCSQEPVTGPYPEANATSPHIPTRFP